MGLEVDRVPRLEDAAALLAERVDRARRAQGPLEPVVVWTPSRTVGAFLKMRLADALQVAANIETSTILKGLDALGAPDLVRLDGALLRGRVLALLHDPEVLAGEVMAPVVRWIGTGESDARDRRRSELAAALGRAFEGYLVARPRWLAKRRNEPQSESERWQMVLFERAITGPSSGAPPETGTTALPLETFVARIVERPLPQEIHVVGWSTMPYGVARALERLAEKTTVRVYSPDPSRGFWSDPSVPIEDLVDDSLVLSRAGPALRELMHRFPTEGGDAGDAREPATLLANLQASLDEGRDLPWPGPLDGTLQIWASPGIRREVEAVAQEIWRRMAETPGLTFDQIAVYYVDREDQPYAPHIRAVFDEAHRIPHRIAEAPLSGESPVVGIAQKLIDLPLGTRTRPEVLGVLTDPLVGGAWHDVDPAEWIKWCDAVGIIRGTDARDLAGTYVEDQPLYHWDQGLGRIALGALTEALPIPGSRLTSAGRLVLMARSLLADAAWAQSTTRPLAEWIRFIGTLVTTYLTPRDEAETRALRACLAAIAQCAKVDAGAAQVSYRIARDLVEEALDGLIAPSGAELAARVHVAPLGTGKIVPFAHVFVIGLGGSAFPSKAGSGDLDLRPRFAGESSKEEDVAEARLDASADDRDRAAFIEVLWSARERLVLSWESRDAITGEEKTPSSLVSDLMRWVRKVSQKPFDPKQLPLRRHEVDPADVVGRLALPSVAKESRAQALGFQAGRSITPLRTRIESAEPAPRRGALGDALGLVPLGTSPTKKEPTKARVVKLSQLRKFLECPLQGSATFALGMRGDDDDDVIAMTEEPLQSPHISRVSALREIFVRAASEVPTLADVEAVFARVQQESWDKRVAQARAPAAVLGEVERAREFQAVKIWLKILGKNREQHFGTRFERVVLGAPEDATLPALVLPPIRIELKDGPVDVVGSTELMSRGATRLGIYPSFPRWGTKKQDRLRALLDHLVATIALGSMAKYELFILAVNAEKKPSSDPVKLAAISPEYARQYLKDLVEDLLDGSFDYLFPFDSAVIDVIDDFKSLEDAVEAVRDQFDAPGGKPASAYGPIRDAASRPTPPQDVADRIIRRRFLRFYELSPQMRRSKE